MKKLSLSDIKNGGLVGQPVAVTIKIMHQGEECEFDTHIKPFSYATAVAKFKAYAEEKEQLAGIIATCITDAKGNPVFTEQEVRENFNQQLIELIWGEIHKVNYPKIEKDDEGKSKPSSVKTTKRGLSSSATESVETPSKPPSTP